ncbi:MAG: preprotein translocase subunit SecG, partial [Myxococcales bacterium]|nr:preprotein translocase subunit SecG [Myxococcales bacterium]
MFYTFIVILHVIVCLFLVLVVLLQSGRGGGIGALGGGGGGGSVFGGRGGATFMSKLTSITAGLFLVLSVLLAKFSLDDSSVTAAPKKAEEA